MRESRCARADIPATVAIRSRRRLFRLPSTGEESMTRKLVPVLVAVCLALSVFAFPPPVAAQSAAGGAIEGTVTDQSGGVLPGVTVSVRNTATGATRETTTDATGLYRAPLLPAGPYDVTASLSRCSSTQSPN